MIPTIANNGSSFKGAAAYYLHDKDADTMERVEWTHTENLLDDDPEAAWKVMAFTAMDGERLKREAGVRGTGRKLTKPVFSFSLAWHPEQNPDKAHMLETAMSAVKTLGLSEYQALYIAHKDEPQRHVHVIINRVHPETGIAVTLGNSKNRLSDWALEYQRQRGETYCPQREVNAKKRKERTHDKTKPVVSYRDPVIVAAWERSDNGKSFQAALNAQGYRLAQGNKRLVIVDRGGKAHNPVRHLGLRTDAFRARIADIDIARLHKAETLQQEARKQSRREYHASRKYDQWSTRQKNDIQDRHNEQRGDLSDRHQRKILKAKHDLAAFYKLDDHRFEIARLKTALRKPSLMRKLTGKEKADREELGRQEQLLADGQQKMADEIDHLQLERDRAFAEQARRHAEEKERLLEMIIENKPEFYREELLKDHARETEKGRDRDNGGRERGRGFGGRA